MFDTLVSRVAFFLHSAHDRRDATGRHRSETNARGGEAQDASSHIPDVPELDRVSRTIAGVDQDTLLTRLRSTDIADAQRALQVIYEALFRQLWSAAYRRVHAKDIAEEIVHDVFFKLWRQRTSIAIRGALTLYLHVAVRNRTYDHLRDVQRNVSHTDPTLESEGRRVEGQSSTLEHPEEHLLEVETDRAFRDALVGISDRDRDILILRWREGWSFNEIAEAVGLSSVACRIVVTRQQRRLRTYLDRLRDELSGS